MKTQLQLVEAIDRKEKEWITLNRQLEHILKLIESGQNSLVDLAWVKAKMAEQTQVKWAALKLDRETLAQMKEKGEG